MFIGQYQYNIDDKNRLVIPQEYRKELGTQIVINKGFEKCITIYPLQAWQEIADSLSTLSINSKDNRTFTRLYTSSAFFKDFDSQGRIKIDDVLKEYAGIKKQCVIVGANKTIEIWSLDGWNSVEEERDDQIVNISEKINL